MGVAKNAHAVRVNVNLSAWVNYDHLSPPTNFQISLLQHPWITFILAPIDV